MLQMNWASHGAAAEPDLWHQHSSAGGDSEPQTGTSVLAPLAPTLKCYFGCGYRPRWPLSFILGGFPLDWCLFTSTSDLEGAQLLTATPYDGWVVVRWKAWLVRCPPRPPPILASAPLSRPSQFRLRYLWYLSGSRRGHARSSVLPRAPTCSHVHVANVLFQECWECSPEPVLRNVCRLRLACLDRPGF